MKKVQVPEGQVASLLGDYDDNLRMLEAVFGVSLSARGDELTVDGEDPDVDRAAHFLSQIAGLMGRGYRLRKEDLQTAANLFRRDGGVVLADYFLEGRIRASAKKTVVPKSENQRRYLAAIRRSDLVFGIGPAGTGKTYLAVAMAASMLNEKRINRIILARPAVEAGERLGFLPGDLAEKVDPYLRPLYDALYDLMDRDTAVRLLQRGTIEVAPLAFMRGRTMNDSFMILDEAQNTTSEQMKMFLTRIGFNSRAVITGDITQIDLPTGRRSGLVEAQAVVGGISGIEFVYFDERDVVRHSLVQEIIKAYDRYGNGPRPGSGREGDLSGPENAEIGGRQSGEGN
jgi:phosphate starvation-inducible PhoH-like protein